MPGEHASSAGPRPPAPAADAPLWTVQEVAEHYRVTERTVYNWIAAGAVVALKNGGIVRIVPPTTTGGTRGAR